MYPLLCTAGFPMPLKAGKFEIVGYSVAARNPALAIEVAIYDDRGITSDRFGRILPNADEFKSKIVHRKGIATYGVQIDSQAMTEPIKTRYGISAHTSNVEGGSFCVYVK
jgi:hypothetical protein